MLDFLRRATSWRVQFLRQPCSDKQPTPNTVLPVFLKSGEALHGAAEGLVAAIEAETLWATPLL